MKRLGLADWLSWGASVILLLVLAFGLDSYRRPPLRYGYGPDRYQYFAATIERARELEETGTYRVAANQRWLLRGGWQDEELAGRGQALAAERRVRLVLPVFEPTSLQLRLRLDLVPARGDPTLEPIELEYGVNGLALGRFLVPPEGDVLKFRVEPSMLHRGDNIVYLYRLTRRRDASPWLSFRWLIARVLE